MTYVHERTYHAVATIDGRCAGLALDVEMLGIQMTGRPNQTKLNDVRNVGLLLAAVLVLMALLQSTDVPSAIDSALRSAYYRSATASQATSRVLLVEADEDTVRAWGDPVWSDERRRELLERIAAGRPAAVVLLDRERTFVSSAVGDRSLPAELMLMELALRIDPGSLAVDTLTDDELAAEWLDPVIRGLGLPPLPSGQLRIHYVTPVSRLPSVTAHRVAQGNVPPSTFEGKIVVVGLTSLTHRDPLATPVGALTTPEIFSHALATLADERRWYEPSWPVRALGLTGVLVVLVLALRTATPSQALVRVAVIAVVLVLADLLAFITNLAWWGVANELLLVLLVLLVYWYLVQRRSAEIAKSMSAELTEQVVEQQSMTVSQAHFWRDMAEIARKYLEVEVTAVIAELPPGRWHLEPRAFMGMTSEGIFERRRDVRRAPYRAAFLTQRAARCDRRFAVDEGRYTMAVPLAYQGRMFGMWMINLANEVVLKAEELAAIEQLGMELGRSIAEARRAEQEARAAVDGANVPTRLSRVLLGIEALGEDKQRILDTFDAIPLGLLIADMWGHVLQVNPAILAQLAFALPDGIPDNDLSAVLSRITNRRIEGVHELMRAAVREGTTFRLRARQGPREATFLLMPMRCGDDDEVYASSGATTRLVLIAVPDVHDASAAMLWVDGTVPELLAVEPVEVAAVDVSVEEAPAVEAPAVEAPAPAVEEAPVDAAVMAEATAAGDPAKASGASARRRAQVRRERKRKREAARGGGKHKESQPSSDAKREHRSETSGPSMVPPAESAPPSVDASTHGTAAQRLLRSA